MSTIDQLKQQLATLELALDSTNQRIVKAEREKRMRLSEEWQANWWTNVGVK